MSLTSKPAAGHDDPSATKDKEHLSVSSSRTATRFGEVATLGSNDVWISGHLQLRQTDRGLRPIRLPDRYWAHLPPAGALVRATASRPSGVRIAVRTSATRLTLSVRCTRLQVGPILAEENSFIASVDGVDIAAASTSIDAIEVISLAGEDLGTRVLQDSSLIEFTDLPWGEKVVEIWLPQMVMVDLIGIEADAPLEPAEPAAQPVWIHHGSSISHCGEPSRPTSAWPVVTGRLAAVNMINLGFAGQCMLDPFVADAIATTPADVITLELGINVVGARAMDQRTFVPAVHGFLDRIRAGHPATPVVIVSPLLWPGNEDKAGPTLREDLEGGSFRYRTAGTAADVDAGALSLTIAREHLRHVVHVRADAGEAIHYLDGRSLYGDEDTARHPLPDGLHPDAELYGVIGHRFADSVFGSTGLLAASS